MVPETGEERGEADFTCEDIPEDTRHPGKRSSSEQSPVSPQKVKAHGGKKHPGQTSDSQPQTRCGGWGAVTMSTEAPAIGEGLSTQISLSLYLEFPPCIELLQLLLGAVHVGKFGSFASDPWVLQSLLDG